MKSKKKLRLKLTYFGRVQGVGFRPWIYRVAREIGIAGFVGNSTQGAFVEIEGSVDDLQRFHEQVRQTPPALVQIRKIKSEEIALVGEENFVILPSKKSGKIGAEVSPDIATCDDCLGELRDPLDRRFRYPFINCTNCGPRLSILQELPYDRSTTTMSSFTMCSACQKEYDDPSDRRFHAQPNACYKCGPKVFFVDKNGSVIAGDPIINCVTALFKGKIIAIKGLSGFNLVCRNDSIQKLRKRKNRLTKPFAIMVNGLKKTPFPTQKPILLQRTFSKKNSANIGLILPYTPLHTLLFETEIRGKTLSSLVFTSANKSNEPLCYKNEDAIERLSGIADAFLMHNREITRPLDDSILLVTKKNFIPLRYARGFTPTPFQLPKSLASEKVSILAFGGDLKSAFAIQSKDNLLLSEHIGDLQNPDTFRHFIRTIKRQSALFAFKPTHIACDLHPNYHSSRFARSFKLPIFEIQHHHAHIASAMVDHKLEGKVIGIACDGTGYGTDGAIWGAEVLITSYQSFQRFAHFQYFPLIGGDRAAKETWRPAAGLLWLTFGEKWHEELPKTAPKISSLQKQIFDAQIAQGVFLQTSSLGRIFDAIAFLLGVATHNHHEALAAMTLEKMASNEDQTAVFMPSKTNPIELTSFIRAFCAKIQEGISPQKLAAGFHTWIVENFVFQALKARGKTGLTRVVLSGGAFANRILVEKFSRSLSEEGFKTYFHKKTPTTDGGIAIGQAAITAGKIKMK